MRLLVVEDEVRLAHALRRGLAADGLRRRHAARRRRRPRAARDGGLRRRAARRDAAGLSGYDVVRSLRAEENWVPVLMVSAKDGPHDQADGLDCGADDYLIKPFSYVVVLARLRALLRRAPRGPPGGARPRRRPPRPGHPRGHASAASRWR